MHRFIIAVSALALLSTPAVAEDDVLFGDIWALDGVADQCLYEVAKMTNEQHLLVDQTGREAARTKAIVVADLAHKYATMAQSLYAMPPIPEVTKSQADARASIRQTHKQAPSCEFHRNLMHLPIVRDALK